LVQCCAMVGVFLLQFFRNIGNYVLCCVADDSNRNFICWFGLGVPVGLSLSNLSWKTGMGVHCSRSVLFDWCGSGDGFS